MHIGAQPYLVAFLAGGWFAVSVEVLLMVSVGVLLGGLFGGGDPRSQKIDKLCILVNLILDPVDHARGWPLSP